MAEPLVPPNALEAESALIAAMIIDPKTVDVVAGKCKPEHCYCDANRLIFEAILALQSDGKPVDIITLKNLLQSTGKLQRVGGTTYIADLLNNVPAITGIEAYAELVRDKWRLRQTIAICQKYAAEGYSEGLVPDQFINRLEADIYSLSNASSRPDYVSFKDAAKDAFLELQRRAKGEFRKVVGSGLRDLDSRMICFGEASDMIIVAARPGQGKTAFAVNNVAISTARKGMGVGVFSLEMDAPRLAYRSICADALVNSRKMTAGQAQAEDWRAVTAAAGDLSRLPLLIDETAGINISELRAKARRMASDFRHQGVELGLIIVDYLQLMEVDRNLGGREEQVASNSRQLKLLAKELDCVALVLSQMNRSIEQRGKGAKPQLSDLRESGAIEQDADKVLFPYHAPEAQGIASIIIAKDRHHGSNGSVSVAWRPEFTRFDNLEQGYNAEPEQGY